MSKTHGLNAAETNSAKPQTKRKRTRTTANDPADTAGTLQLSVRVDPSNANIRITDVTAPGVVRKPQPRPRKKVRKEAGGTPEGRVPNGEAVLGGREPAASGAQGDEGTS